MIRTAVVLSSLLLNFAAPLALARGREAVPDGYVTDRPRVGPGAGEKKPADEVKAPPVASDQSQPAAPTNHLPRVNRAPRQGHGLAG